MKDNQIKMSNHDMDIYKYATKVLSSYKQSRQKGEFRGHQKITEAQSVLNLLNYIAEHHTTIESPLQQNLKNFVRDEQKLLDEQSVLESMVYEHSLKTMAKYSERKAAGEFTHNKNEAKAILRTLQDFADLKELGNKGLKNTIQKFVDREQVSLSVNGVSQPPTPDSSHGVTATIYSSGVVEAQLEAERAGPSQGALRPTHR